MSHPSLAQIRCWSISSCPSFLKNRSLRSKSRFTEVTENVEEVNTPQGAEFVEQETEVQEQFTEVQENIEVIEQ